MKKINIEFVRSKLAEYGYKLLSTEYKGAGNKLIMECPEEHIIKLSWAKFKKGRSCKYCNKSRVWFKDIVELFKKDGYELFTKESEYINSKKTKLKFKCDKGHFGEISLAHWKDNSRCKICYLERRTLKFNYVKNEIEKSGYKVLSDESTYNNSKTKLKLECDEGHIVYISWNSWKAKVRCKKCSLKKRDAKARLKYGFIKKEFEKRGCTLLSKTYENAFGKLDYICARGHTCSTRWNDFQQNCGCIYCAIEDNTGSGHWNWKGGISCEPYCDIWKDKEYAEFIKQRDGHKCMNPYCDSKNPNDLTRHHIEYNKKSCRPKDLITVCRSCNFKANYDREWHEAWYKAIMYRRYGYKY
jgi:hypothetical protein